MANVITGNTPPRVCPENYGDYIEWIKTDNIINLEKLTRAEESLSKKGFDRCRYVNKGAILMTCIAGSLNTIGNMVIVDRRVAFNQQINAICPHEAEATYILYALQANRGQLHSKTKKSLT